MHEPDIYFNLTILPCVRESLLYKYSSHIVERTEKMLVAEFRSEDNHKKNFRGGGFDHLHEIVQLPPLGAVILDKSPGGGDPKADARHLDEAGLHHLQLPRLCGRPRHQETGGRHRT